MPPSQRDRNVLDALRAAMQGLVDAPHKHRIDFQPYWDWYDGPRARALAEANAALAGVAEVK